MKYFSRRKTKITGNPIRQRLIKAAQSISAKIPKQENKYNVLVFGGSQGSRAINECFKYIPLMKNISFNLLDGSNYIYNMEDYYSQADIVICRAGASTIAELILFELPAVLIPYPYAAENHQLLNAQVLVEAGGAVLLPETNLSAQSIADIISSLVNKPEALFSMKESLKSLKKINSVEIILKNITESLS